MNYFDAHCHLADPRLDDERDELIERSRQGRITGWIQGGVDPADWRRQRALREKYGPGIVCVFGLHPWRVADFSKDSGTAQSRLKEALVELDRELEHASALGELGLDFGRKTIERAPESRELQLAAFRGQLELARARGKPIVLHIVHAHEDALAILEAGGPLEAGGIVHSYSGGPEQARRYLKLGLCISAGGGLTRVKHDPLKQTVRGIPGEFLMLETDSPDQPPGGWPGLNEPLTLWKVAEAAGELRGEAPETLLERSSQAIARVFRIESSSRIG